KDIAAKPPETAYRGFLAQHGYASSTPATDGERVYVFFGKTGVFAFDLDGNQVWDASVGTNTHGWGSATSVLLTKDLVIVNASVASGAIVALNKKDGKQAWKAPGIRSSWSSPVLVDVADGKQEVVVSMQGRVLGFDPENGKELWRCDGIRDYVCPTVVAKDGIVYAIGGRSAQALAVKAGGRGDVTESNRLWTFSGGSNVTSPVVAGDHLFWVSDSGTAYCLELKEGKKVYSE